MSNRLEGETSPYLRQHRDNPVDWYPWGDAAFERAVREDKPVLLSIGYSACHWCHVMAHESFEDPHTAELMNRHFVNVKVDREERPDVDAVYMSAVQAMTGSGGWPMTVVVTPQGEPFFGGTYFPPEDRFGQPSFRRVLNALAAAWRERRDEVLESARGMREHLDRLVDLRLPGGAFDPALPERALASLERSFDAVHGGFGGAPKFPPHSVLRWLLRRPEERAREMAHHTLRSMALGGIYDQLGGGFARYSVDARWLVPHFEKMLYDNAQLLSRYAEAYALTADPLYARVLDDTSAWMLRELATPDGGFASALDADSEGEEGRFYLWDAAEVDDLLADEAPLARAWYGIGEVGNFEGRTVLTAPADEAAVAARAGIDAGEVLERARAAGRKLLAAREKRVRPGLDDKVVTSWNGLALAGLADAGRALRRSDLIDHARHTARFLRARLWRDGRLWHVFAGGEARVPGLLEDYVYLASGLLALYRATFEPEWLVWALELAEVVPAHFSDPRGGFFSTPDDGEALIVRPKGLFDAAVPAENAAAAELLVVQGRLTGEAALEAQAAAALEGVLAAIGEQPSGFGASLCAFDLLLAPSREVAVIGDPDDADTRALLRILQQQPLPYTVMAQASGEGDPLAERLPFLRGRGRVEGRAAAYVCRSGTCRLPLTSPDALAQELA